MLNPSELNIQELSESIDLEVKLALGRDGRGQVPENFYETYSAMANTDGGVVLLGVRQKNGRFELEGVEKPERLVDDLWSNLNNRQKVSENILQSDRIAIKVSDGRKIIEVTIPRASRKQRPVFLNGNPLRHTYRRRASGDYLCDELTVRRMLADQLDETPDTRVLEKFNFNDIDEETLKTYRQIFKTNKPDHLWSSSGDVEFLKHIGGWALDRETGKEGPTAAGLLMFGRYEAIREVFPNYFLDYQESPNPSSEQRWTDRITPDGTWPGNVFSFYRKVSSKLIQDLKVPFKLEGGIRVDDTPVHQALREALINTLIHADYAGTTPILIVKQKDFFGFRNPGNMRVPLEEAKQGTLSDCRNKNLQLMFRMIGAVEQAGTGIPKIYKSWKDQQWAAPILAEKTTPPDYTVLKLRMISLIPEETLADLKVRFGKAFSVLDDFKRLILATVALERTTNNRRLQEISDKHPVDISKALGELVRGEFLEPGGAGRWAFYYFPGDTPKDPENTGESLLLSGFDLQHLGWNSSHLKGDLSHLKGDLSHLQRKQSRRKKENHVEPGTQLWIQAKTIAEPVSSKGKAPVQMVRETILKICELGFCRVGHLAKLIKRKPESIRNSYVFKLLQEGHLESLVPEKPNHPKQAYRRRIK